MRILSEFKNHVESRRMKGILEKREMAGKLSVEEAACVSSLRAGWSLQFGVRAELLKVARGWGFQIPPAPRECVRFIILEEGGRCLTS